jgi:hypothetical protein
VDCDAIVLKIDLNHISINHAFSEVVMIHQHLSNNGGISSEDSSNLTLLVKLAQVTGKLIHSHAIVSKHRKFGKHFKSSRQATNENAMVDPQSKFIKVVKSELKEEIKAKLKEELKEQAEPLKEMLKEAGKDFLSNLVSDSQ